MSVDKSENGTAVTVRDRLKHFTWAWFALTMSAGGIALLLAVNPHRFRGLTIIGTVIFIADLNLFSIFTGLLLHRFFTCPGTFTQSVHHPTESLFIATWFLSISVIISCMQEYGVPSTGPWLITMIRVLFWLYTAITFLTSVIQYHILFTGKHLTIQNMTPAWIFPVFPVMLSGTLASGIAASQPPYQAIPILLAGTTFQTLGFMVALLFYANFVRRLMTDGLPSPPTRPGMFVSVGPPSFTGLAFIGMSNAAIKVFPHTFVVGTDDVPTAQVLKIMATFFAIGLWTLSLFFFSLATIAVGLEVGHTTFHLTWWGCVFPNTGFIISTIAIGNAIDSPAILWTGSVATVIQVGVFLCVLVAHVRAVLKDQILWPGRDEDHDA